MRFLSGAGVRVRHGGSAGHCFGSGKECTMTIEHIAMYVNNLDGARLFFEKYFDGTAGALYNNETTGFRSYFLSFGDGARLEIMTRPDAVDMAKPPFRTGYAHIAFSVGSRENVDDLTKRLKADGFAVTSGPRVTGDGYYESCVVAIEGNLVEITV